MDRRRDLVRRGSLPEKRTNPRRGLALRVILRDHRPPMHAMTRNLSLGGMYLMTATRKLQGVHLLTAEIEIDRQGQRWTAPLPVRVVWSDHTSTGVMFKDPSPATISMLTELLDDAVPLPARRRHHRVRA